ncbi:general transcription factor 3c polypeptide 4 family [Anaeramoeba flamelloides]|uniref:General transcription factor 3c polypeptide 4 family n=1 Tax=Anaeramoeba flamelloides TaxID=1746091 RepID=A0AAV7YU06_9EUKA|nr:general transcription factor 3c polypeptide 4 family [Anaeramoeba flamelloides]
MDKFFKLAKFSNFSNHVIWSKNGLIGVNAGDFIIFSEQNAPQIKKCKQLASKPKFLQILSKIDLIQSVYFPETSPFRIMSFQKRNIANNSIRSYSILDNYFLHKNLVVACTVLHQIEVFFVNNDLDFETVADMNNQIYSRLQAPPKQKTSRGKKIYDYLNQLSALDVEWLPKVIINDNKYAILLISFKSGDIQLWKLKEDLSSGRVIIINLSISQENENENEDENISMDIENENNENKLNVEFKIIYEFFEKDLLSPSLVLKWSSIILSGHLIPRLAIAKNCLLYIWDQKMGIFGISAHKSPINSLEWGVGDKIIYSSGEKEGVKSWKIKLTQNETSIVEKEVSIKYDKNIPVLSLGLSPHSSILLLVQRMGIVNMELPSEKVQTQNNFFYINNKKNNLYAMNYLLENSGYNCMDFFFAIKQYESFQEMVFERAEQLIKTYNSQKGSIIEQLLEAKFPTKEFKTIQTANLFFYSLEKIEKFKEDIKKKIQQIEIEIVNCYIMYVFATFLSNINLINENDLLERDKKALLLMADYFTLQKKILPKKVIQQTIQVLNYFQNNDQAKILSDQTIIEQDQIKKLLPKRDMLPIVDEPIAISSIFLEKIPGEDLYFKRCAFSLKLISDEEYLICPCCSRIVEQNFNFSFPVVIEKESCLYCGNLFLKKKL